MLHPLQSLLLFMWEDFAFNAPAAGANPAVYTPLENPKNISRLGERSREILAIVGHLRQNFFGFASFPNHFCYRINEMRGISTNVFGGAVWCQK